MSGNPWPIGLVTAIVTPFRDNRVDNAALASLVEYQISNGAGGLAVSGGTGEYYALSFEERAGLFRDVVQVVAGRVPVIAASGCLTTRDAIRLSQAAQASGVLGLLLASPYAEALNWRERMAFYTQLDSSVSLPIMIYNTPPSGLLSFAQIRELAELPNITAVKDSSGDPELMGDLNAWAGDREFGVYVGKDSFLYEAIATGARGAVFGAANFIPGELSRLIAILQAEGGTSAALAQWRAIRPLLRVMEYATNYISLCKIGCGLRGIDVGVVRPPYMMPEVDEIATLTRALAALDDSWRAA